MSQWFVCGPDLADRPNHIDNRDINIYPVAARGIPPPDGAEVEHLALWCVLYSSTMHGGKPRDRPPPYVFVHKFLCFCLQIFLQYVCCI